MGLLLQRMLQLQSQLIIGGSYKTRLKKLSNLMRKDLLFPQMLLGYRMEGTEAIGKHVWLMERIEGGRRVLFSRPKQEEDLRKEVELLRSHGHTRVWITPKIPFIVPIFISLVLTAFIGNPFFLLFGF